MCTPIESAVRPEAAAAVAARGALTAHGDLALLVGVTGFTQEPLGKGPVKALAPATSNEQQIAVDFILSFSLSLLLLVVGARVLDAATKREQVVRSAVGAAHIFSGATHFCFYPPPLVCMTETCIMSTSNLSDLFVSSPPNMKHASHDRF